MNKVLLVGRIVRDIEVKTTQNGKDYSFNAIACKRDYKNKDGKYDADFIPITFGNVISKFVKDHLSKGDLVEIVGKWRTYNDKDNKQVDECVVDTITIIDKAKPKTNEQELDNVEEPNDDPEPDLPF